MLRCAQFGRDSRRMPLAIHAARSIKRPKRLYHHERRFLTGPQADFSLGETGTGVSLEQAVREVGPFGALLQERDLSRAFDHHHVLNKRCNRHHGHIRYLAQRRATITEDPRIAIVIRADPLADAHIGQHAGEDMHRMRLVWIFHIVLYALKPCLLTGVLQLQPGDEHRALAFGVHDECDRSFRRDKGKAGEVVDVRAVKQDDALQPTGAAMLQ